MSRRNEEFENVVGLPTDGGWGWMVTFVCFSASFTLDSASYAFHAFEIPLGHQLNVKGSSVAVIMAVYLCCSYVAGPLASGIANRYGFRITMMLGSSMGFVGMLCSYFAVDNYEYYIFFFGILSGIGADMLFVTSMVAVGFWFEKRRATAIGISTCGTGMTAIITPVIANYITKNFGWRIVFALLSGEFGACIFLGMLLRPAPVVKVAAPELDQRVSFSDRVSLYQTFVNPGQSVVSVRYPLNTRTRQLLERRGYSVTAVQGGTKDSGGGGCWRRCCGPKVTGARPLYRQDIFYQGSVARITGPSGPDGLQYALSVTRMPRRRDLLEEEGRCECCPEAMVNVLTEMMDFTLLKSPIFMLAAVSSVFFIAAVFIPVLYIKAVAVSKNMDESYMVWLLPSLGMGTTVGRLVSGLLLGLFPFLSALDLNTIAVVAASLLMFGYQFVDSGPVIITMNVFYGFVFGLAIPLRSVILIDYLGLDRLTNATGLLFVFQGIGSLIGPPLARTVVEWQDAEKWSFIIAGTGFLTAAITLYPIKIVYKYMNG